MHVDVPGQAVDDVAVPVVHPGLAAADQPDAGVEPLERLGPPPGLGHVLRRRPAAGKLLAQAPEPDAVGLGMAVGTPPAGPVVVAGAVAVLHPGQRLVQGAGAHVQAEHRLGARGRAPGHELVGAEAVGLLAGTGGTPRPARADAVGPVVTRREGPAGPAHVGHAEVPDGREHVGAEAAGPGPPRPLVEHAAVDTAPQVLGDAAENTPVDGADGPLGQHVDLGHRPLPPDDSLLPAVAGSNRIKQEGQDQSRLDPTAPRRLITATPAAKTSAAQIAAPRSGAGRAAHSHGVVQAS